MFRVGFMVSGFWCRPRAVEAEVVKWSSQRQESRDLNMKLSIAFRGTLRAFIGDDRGSYVPKHRA